MPTQARLLILDGHGSHTTDDFMWNGFNNNIHLVFLPPHTSHVLQPLDLSVFSPLKHSYRKYLNNINCWAESTVVGKQLMLKCLLKARRDAISYGEKYQGRVESWGLVAGESNQATNEPAFT